MSAPIRYADFQPGATLGAHEEAYSPALAQDWQRIFGQAGPGSAAEAASIAMVLAMRAYLSVVTPRPPGNVHARQQLALIQLPQPGETVRTRVRCAGKECKRERLYVDLQVDGTGQGGRALYTGTMRLIWAA